MKNVLIFTYLQRHLKKMLPIIKEFQNDSRFHLYVVLMTQEEKQIANENNIDFNMLDDYTTKKRNYDFDLAWGIEPLITAIDTIKPDLFIAIEVNYILRNAVRYCKQKGIKSIVIQHGTPNKYSMHAFAPFEGDYFLAWGDFSKNILIKNYVPEDKIIVTGGMNFDQLHDINSDRQKISDYFKIDLSKKWITFTTQGKGAGDMPTEDEIRTGIVETAKELEKNKEWQLIFQVHPGQKVEDIKDILEENNLYHAVVGKYPYTDQLLKESNAVITFFSTTAIDAMLLCKPLLLINLSDDCNFFPFVSMGVALGAYNSNEISIKIEHLISNYKVDKQKMLAVQSYINYLNDNNALERIYNFCLSVLEEK